MISDNLLILFTFDWVVLFVLLHRLLLTSPMTVLTVYVPREVSGSIVIDWFWRFCEIPGYSGEEYLIICVNGAA